MKFILFFYVIITFHITVQAQLLSTKSLKELQFKDTVPNNSFQFIYQNQQNSPQLNTLKTDYKLDSIGNKAKSEFERILLMLNWTHQQWQHNGSNQPSSQNTLVILQEAKKGANFRCVEYGVVLRSSMACLDIPARTLGLKLKQVETINSGGGHVLTEVYSHQFNKWFVLDAQFNLVPMLDDVPINAVEFQHAIAQNKNFYFLDINGQVSTKRTKQYLKFITDYLYYFDFRFDQREVAYQDLHKVNDKIVLMLVPLTAKIPTVFQRKYDLNYAIYTNNINDFYRKP